MRTITLIALITLLLPLPGRAAQRFDETFDVAIGATLDIDLDTGGSITIVGDGGGSVRVQGSLRGRNADDVEVRIEPSGGGVRITSEPIHHGRSFSASFDLEISVPSQFDVKVESMGGGIAVRDLEGTITGSTMGGELELERLRGRLDLSTMGGNIELLDSEVDGSVSTMGGKVLLRNVVGDVKGSSMGGNVIYNNVTRSDGSGTGDEVHISTMGGAVKVAEAPAGADLQTMGGPIVVDSAARFVKATTMGGNIKLREIDGWIDATTMGGDIDATLIGEPVDGDPGVSLTSMGGDITLEVPAGLSMTFDVEIAYTKRSRRNFRIESDFPITVEESQAWHYEGDRDPRKTISGTGTVAGGEHRIKIRTVNGNVIIRRGS